MEKRREVEDAPIEAYGKAEVVEAEVEHLKGVLAKAEADLALKRGKRKAKVVKAKRKLAEAEKRAKERSAKAGHLAMEVYKALTNFAIKKAQAMAAIRKLEEFYEDHIKFNDEAFQEVHKLGRANYQLLVHDLVP